MKRWSALVAVAATGCSTAPLTGLMDRFRPGRVEPAARDRDGADGPVPPGMTPNDGKAKPRLGEPFPALDAPKPIPRY